MRVTMHRCCWWLICQFLALPLCVASRQTLDRSWPHGLDGWQNASKHMKHGCGCVVEVLHIVLCPDYVCLVWDNGPNVVRCRSQLKLRCNVPCRKCLGFAAAEHHQHVHHWAVFDHLLALVALGFLPLSFWSSGLSSTGFLSACWQAFRPVWPSCYSFSPLKTRPGR